MEVLKNIYVLLKNLKKRQYLNNLVEDMQNYEVVDFFSLE